VWLTGGFPAARGGPYVWRPGPPENDQSAAAYRAADVVMLVPTVRGTADNPGVQEAFLGEVDDVLAAARHLRSLEHVDPERVYLGGHSTGGTLALLVAESTDLFRGVVAFGPVGRVTDYGGRTWPFDPADPAEVRLRSPLHFLDSIRTPTLIVEGSRANVEDLLLLDEATDNPAVRFVLLDDEDHFTPVAPVNRWLARRIAVGDAGLPPASADEVRAAVHEFQREQREARDLRTLADLRAEGIALGEPTRVEFTALLRTAERLEDVRTCFEGFAPGAVDPHVDEAGDPVLLLRWRRELVLTPRALFEATAAFRTACRAAWVQDEGWTLVRDER
jgi:dienelactone hydrolase